MQANEKKPLETLIAPLFSGRLDFPRGDCPIFLFKKDMDFKLSSFKNMLYI